MRDAIPDFTIFSLETFNLRHVQLQDDKGPHSERTVEHIGAYRNVVEQLSRNGEGLEIFSQTRKGWTAETI